MAAKPPGEPFSTDVPGRLDRLAWGRFHWLVVAALGITWILDGLEVTLVGSLSPAIARSLGFGDAEVGWSGTAYVLGSVLGALIFGRLTDRFGRRKLFTITVGVYLAATLASGLSWNFASFAFFRFVTGAGIGGEYGAVNSAIQELIPARRRGYADLAINGSFWVGAALGAAGSLAALDPALVAPALGWRLAFIIGATLALVIVWLRRFVPESPRWLLTHGRPEEAEAVATAIEARSAPRAQAGEQPAPRLAFRSRGATSWGDVGRTLLMQYRRRTILVMTLMATQAFCYNAIFFTYALILSRFYRIAPGAIGWFILPFAAGNFAGPLLLGPVRQRRAAADDRPHLCFGRRSSVPDRLVVQPRRTRRRRPHRGLERDLLLRLGRSQRRLSHRRRVLSAGDPGRGYLPFLRFRIASRRRRPGLIRRPDRQRRSDPRPVGLPFRRRLDDPRRRRRPAPWRRRRTQVPGGHRPAAFEL